MAETEHTGRNPALGAPSACPVPDGGPQDRATPQHGARHRRSGEAPASPAKKPVTAAKPAQQSPPATRPTRAHRSTPRATDANAAKGQTRPVRRQARGERRITQILEAAATVFTEVGYPAATTNAIARAAKVSPGTLYQFFPNKEAIAVELGERLLGELRNHYGQALDPANADLPLEEMLDLVLDPMIEFNCRHPVFLALMNGSEVPGALVREHDATHASLMARTDTLIAVACPSIPEATRRHVTTLAFGIFKAGMDLVLAHEGEDRAAYVTELKSALYRYLSPTVDTEDS